MRLFFERQIVGMAITSPEKGWIQVNDRLIQMLGYSREELACRTWEELTHPEDIATDLDQFNRLLSGEIDEYSMGKRFIRKNGSVIFTNISIGCVRGADRSVTFILALLEDITERKRAEENLRESEVRYRTLFEDANDGIGLADIETGHLVDCNQALCRMVERDKGELVGKPQSILHPTESCSDNLSQTFRQHSAGDLQESLEDHFLSKSGKILTVDIRASRIRIGGHEFLLGIFRDITERKQTEEDLRSKDKQLTEITSRLPCLVFQFIAGWDGSRTVSYVNGQVEKMLGLAPDPQGFFERFTAAVLIDQRLDFINTVEKTVREVAEWKYEGPIAKPSGEIIWISGIASPTKTLEGIVYDGVIVDITEPKLAEEALRESEQRHREYIENTPFGVFVTNEQGQYLQVNPAACRITGYTEEELLAMSIPDLLFKETLAEDILHFQALVREGKCQCEIRFCPKNGERRWWSVTAVKISDKLFLGFCNDISDRKFAEEERANLEAENRQLQKAESLGLMAGAIAHHINNQLGAVIGNLEMTLEDLPQGSEMVKSLTSAMKASRQAAEIGSQMLTYLGQSTGIRKLLDLSETCRQSLPLLQAAVPHGLIFKVDLPSPGPTISANANQLQQVLTNLVTNAWEAIADNKGTLGLTVKMASPAEKSAANKFPSGWQPEDGTPYACLEVIDTGCGISREYIEKIFDPFFSTKFTGRGLGLPVVLGIVKTHHGAVTVESALGRGSSFRVLLPMSAGEIPEQLQTVQPLATEGRGTVLLVDDEEILREMAVTMIARLGYTVLEAKNGIEAVELFRQHQDEIRCVLSDVTMPHMDGWETLAALRKLSPDIPVILSSGYDEAQVIRVDQPERPQAFLHKPYMKTELKEVLAKTITS